MNREEMISQLETIAGDLYRIRLPVEEANAYGTVLKSANRLLKMAQEMKVEKVSESENKDEVNRK